MFRKAIVRTPCPSVTNGITTACLGKPDYELALKQHQNYTGTLMQLGLDVEILPANDRFPDSTFIEDIALCTSSCAVITRPGAPSRREETAGMDEVLKKYFDEIEKIVHPGTLEAGDVMMAGKHFYIGISGRTNHEGADQLIRILENHGLTGSKIQLKNLLHLKSGVSYLEDNCLLVVRELSRHQEFAKYDMIIIPEIESYAANSLWINGTIIVPDGFPATREQIEKKGFSTVTADVSEFRKIDGGLSCLSLRF